MVEEVVLVAVDMAALEVQAATVVPVEGPVVMVVELADMEEALAAMEEVVTMASPPRTTSATT